MNEAGRELVEAGRELAETGLELLAMAAAALIGTSFAVATAVTVDGALPKVVG